MMWLLVAQQCSLLHQASLFASKVIVCMYGLETQYAQFSILCLHLWPVLLAANAALVTFFLCCQRRPSLHGRRPLHRHNGDVLSGTDSVPECCMQQRFAVVSQDSIMPW
jgi:hypothetical protein